MIGYPSISTEAIRHYEKISFVTVNIERDEDHYVDVRDCAELALLSRYLSSIHLCAKT